MSVSKFSVDLVRRDAEARSIERLETMPFDPYTSGREGTGEALQSEPRPHVRGECRCPGGPHDPVTRRLPAASRPLKELPGPPSQIHHQLDGPAPTRQVL